MNLQKKLAFSWPHFEVFMVIYVQFWIEVENK